MNMQDLSELSNNIINTELIVNFSNEELEKVNQSIQENESTFLIKLLEEKERIIKKKEKDILLENINNLCEFILDRCYNLWTPELKGRIDFLSLLSNFEREIVKIGNLDRQLENGGFEKWYKNGYYNDIDEILEFVINSNFVNKDTLVNILKDCSMIIDSIDMLDETDIFYQNDYDTRIKLLNKNNEKYNEIKTEWKNYIDNYIYENLPNDYFKIIKEYNKNISI